MALAAFERPVPRPGYHAGRVALPREGRSVPERSGEPWNFCGKCGRAMAWFQVPRKVHSRVTGELVDIFSWECPSYLPHETGIDRHDHMSRAVNDPAMPVKEAT